MTTRPFVSVVIPTHQRAAMLSSCLMSLAALDYPNDSYELVVVDAASTDGTPEQVQRLASVVEGLAVRYVHRSVSDANAARNAGLGVARGELIALVDDDVVVPPSWLGAMVSGAGRWPGAFCFGGPVRPLFEARPPTTCPHHELAGTLFDEGRQEMQIAEVWGGNMALRREALKLAGPFREGLRLHQDWEWQQRLVAGGGRITYLPEAWLWHRRLRRDLRVVPMLYEFLLRGYLRASLDEGVKARYAVHRARRWGRHALRARCTRGMTETARSIGLLCGVIRRRAARRASPAR
jgi:cellulose synthase/poly-beta-1,6-N-acetylglucosamine synthase-like glycosyltransferase